MYLRNLCAYDILMVSKHQPQTRLPIPPMTPFACIEGTKLLDAIETDLTNTVDVFGSIPTIARYDSAVNPLSNPREAAVIVHFSLELAGRYAPPLAQAWRTSHPAWRKTIDRCLAAVMIECDPSSELAESVNSLVGPLQSDGQGRYRLLEKIGSGRDGSVFLAGDRALAHDGAEPTVALKAVACAESEVGASLAEAAIARRVAHSGVARVLDAGILDQAQSNLLSGGDFAIFIVTEFVDGMPLHVWIAAHPKRTAIACRTIVTSLRGALSACHSIGVVHGDVSPANVVIDGDGVARIVDFGRARYLRQRQRSAIIVSDDVARVDWLAGLLFEGVADIQSDDLPPAPVTSRSVWLRRRIAISTATLFVLALVWHFTIGWRPQTDGEKRAIRIFGDSALDASSPEGSRVAIGLLTEGSVEGIDLVALRALALQWSLQVNASEASGAPNHGLSGLAATAWLAVAEPINAQYFAFRSLRRDKESESMDRNAYSKLIDRLARSMSGAFGFGGPQRWADEANSLDVGGVMKMESIRSALKPGDGAAFR